jgi:predicted MPP superfamily phosphohydrolase
MIVSPLISVLLCLLAGGCAYLYFLNRYLIELKDRGRKFPVIASTLAATLLGSVLFGAAAAGTPWMIAPGIVLAATALGEVRRAVIRRRCRGEPPVAQENVRTSLARPLTTTDLAVMHYVIACPEWSGRDLRIAHVSDFHVNHRLPAAYYESVLRRVAETQPDLVFLTGDFVSKREFLPLLPGFLSIARGKLGTTAVLGNHDYWVSGDEVADAVRSAGVTWLGDGCLHYVVAGPDGPAPAGSPAGATTQGSPLRVCGCERPWAPGEGHFPAAEPGALTLVLTHTPDNIHELSGPGVAAVFAGHYHAGQIRIPLLGSLVVPSAYGRLFDQGHFVVNGTHLFVTAGVGAAIPPFRVYCQPDILIVDIRGRASSWRPT